MKSLMFFILLTALVALTSCSDITNAVFGKELDGMPAAFGDFNSDELTDVFVLSKDGKTVQIMFASVEEPLLQPKKGFSCAFNETVSSVVPGDFDGDVFMDILVTTVNVNRTTNVYILWGGYEQLNCTEATKPLFQMRGQPLAIDYNQDMIIDLFGADLNKNRVFWVFNSQRKPPKVIPMEKPKNLPGKQIYINIYVFYLKVIYFYYEKILIKFILFLII